MRTQNTGEKFQDLDRVEPNVWKKWRKPFGKSSVANFVSVSRVAEERFSLFLRKIFFEDNEPLVKIFFSCYVSPPPQFPSLQFFFFTFFSTFFSLFPSSFLGGKMVGGGGRREISKFLNLHKRPGFETLKIFTLTFMGKNFILDFWVK